MSDFLRALGSYRKGDLSRQGLLAEIDRQLTLHSDDPVTMLAVLDEEHARLALPDSIHGAVSGRILNSLEISSANPTSRESPDEAAWYRDPDSSVTVLADGNTQQRTVVRPENGASPRLDTFSSSATGEKTAPIPIGSVLKHRFKLVACIGEGGMGRVYKAIDLRRVEARLPDVYVAVKVLTRSFRDYSGSLALLQSEATKLQRLSHPNIVRVIDCDRDGDTVFMTMEYLSGQPLKRILQSVPARGMTSASALPILERIADALACAHRNDIVHGDLKPSNVIVTDEGEVKVIDFGIARMVASSAHKGAADPHAESEALSGLTPSYASPEMLEQQPPDPRDDVYALACIGHELLTGVHPFERSAATAARDAGLKVRRRALLARRQYKAIVGGLQFNRENRTPTVERFMQDWRGDRAASARRLVIFAGLAAIVIAAGVYALLTAQPASKPAPLVAGDVFRDCPTCPLMKVLPAGKFQQGSAEGEPDAESFEKPRHLVTLALPVGFGTQEVTRGQYQEFVDDTQRKTEGCAVYDGEWKTSADMDWSNVGFPQTASHPATCVSWQDAVAYAAWLSTRTEQHYRLPSASEWEYAARAGTDASRPWNESTAEACAAANVADASAAERYPGWNVHPCNDGYVFTAPVGAFAANAFGLSDMFGNVFEWVEDCWHENYQGAPVNGSAWVQQAGCQQREMRGGSWFTTPAYVRAAYRNRFEPEYRSSSIGFRLVREIHK